MPTPPHPRERHQTVKSSPLCFKQSLAIISLCLFAVLSYIIPSKTTQSLVPRRPALSHFTNPSVKLQVMSCQNTQQICLLKAIHRYSLLLRQYPYYYEIQSQENDFKCAGYCRISSGKYISVPVAAYFHSFHLFLYTRESHEIHYNMIITAFQR